MNSVKSQPGGKPKKSKTMIWDGVRGVLLPVSYENSEGTTLIKLIGTTGCQRVGILLMIT